MKKQRTFYFKDMILYMCRKWRVILIWMVAFAILFNGYAAIKSYKNISAVQQTQNIDTVDLETYTAELSDNDIKKVDETYDLYLTYKKSLDYSLDYYNHSIRMKIDPNKVSTISMQYQINNAKNISDIVVAFENIVTSKESCDTIKNKLNLDEDTQYISELIQFELSQKESKQDDLSNQTSITIPNEESNNMIVKVIASDKETCEIIADVVEEEIQLVTQEIQESLGGFKLTKVDRNYFENADNGLLDEQQSYIVKLNSIKTSMENLMTPLDDNQKNYYKALINQEEEKNDEKPVAVTQKVQIINAKYIVVGLFVGLVLSCAWYFVIYIFNKYLLVGRELEEYYNIQILDSFNGNDIKKKQFFIDRIINWIFNVEENGCEENKIQMICTNILIYAQRKDIKNLYITSAADSEEIETIEEQIINWFKNTSINITKGNSIIVDSDSLKKLASSDGVVLIEQVGKSDFVDIGKEVYFCEENNIDIIGSIAIN